MDLLPTHKSAIVSNCFFCQHGWMTLFLFVTGVTWPHFPPSSSVFAHYSCNFTLVNKSYSWDSLPGVTERTTTGFSLPATNPKPSTGSRLISTFRGAGGTNLSPSRRTSSRELLWETWLLVERSSLIRACALMVLLSVMWQQTKHVSNNNCCLESISLAHLKTLLFKKQISKCHFQMRPAKNRTSGRWDPVSNVCALTLQIPTAAVFFCFLTNGFYLDTLIMMQNWLKDAETFRGKASLQSLNRLDPNPLDPFHFYPCCFVSLTNVHRLCNFHMFSH